MKLKQSRLNFRLAAVALCLVAAQACQDGTGPTRVARVTIAGAPATPLLVGDSVILSATTSDAAGAPLAGRTVQWSTTAPGVATVDQGGKVKGLAPGTAKIIATSESAADTADIVVEQRSAGCTATGTALSVGEVRLLDPRTDPAVCLAPGTGEYTLIAFNGVETGSLSLTVEGGTAPANRIAQNRARGVLGLAFGRPEEPTRNHAFEVGLRARERNALAARRAGLRASRASASRSASTAAAVPAVGDLINLNVSLESCSNAVRRGARVAAVTQRAVVVMDTANPAGGFSDEEARQIGVAFDTLVYPVAVDNFGAPTDIDANVSRVVIFYTRAVNELTEQGEEDSYVGGFFYARDLLPTSGTSPCQGSNVAEIFYVLAADPTGAVNGNERSKDFVREVTIGTIAHEFEHLINASRRFDNRNFDLEESWLDEGLAHISEELVFYKASGLGPKQNLNVDPFRGAGNPRFDALVEFQGGNFGRYRAYLEDPERNSPYQQDDDLETRGASWAFLRYAADRVVTDQRAFWNRLVNSQTTGFANLRAALGTEPIPLVRDFAVSVYTDDFVQTSAIYQQPSWAFRPLFNAVFSQSGGFTLRVRPLSTGTQTIDLAPGGASYITIAQNATSRVNVRLRSAGVAPPTTLSAFLVRTK